MKKCPSSLKYTTLFSKDNKSYFKDEDPGIEKEQPLGSYSKKFPVKGMQFRTFKEGAKYDWHNAPQPQYIVYLKGKVKIEASGGEIRIFKPGDILLATDLVGEGHITETLTEGESLILTTQEEEREDFTL